MAKATRKSKAPAARKSKAPVPLSRAREQAAKRLGIPDLDYAEKQLRAVLAQSAYGRDWGARVVDPGARVERLWQPASAWTVEWALERAWRMILSAGIADMAFERAYVRGIWIAPKVIAALVSVVPRGKSPGAPQKYNLRQLESAARKVITEQGCPEHVEGDGGLLEKASFVMADRGHAMPGRTLALEIIGPIFKRECSGK
jgi:hypothetical protein